MKGAEEMNLKAKFSRCLKYLQLLTAAIDREITDYWRNFFHKEQDK